MKTHTQNQIGNAMTALLVILLLMGAGCSKSANVGSDSERASDTIDSSSDTRSIGTDDSETSGDTETGVVASDCIRIPRSIVGVSDELVYVVGRCGLILRYDGTTWTDISVENTYDFYDGVAFGPENIYLAGTKRTAVPEEENSRCASDLDTDDPCYQFSGHILHYNGVQTSVALEAESNSKFGSIHGNAPDRIFATGAKTDYDVYDLVPDDRINLFYGFDGSDWENLFQDEDNLLEPPKRVWSTESKLWGFYHTEVQIEEGKEYTCYIQYFENGKWNTFHTIDHLCTDIAATNGGAIFVATHTGGFFNYDGVSWSSEPWPDGAMPISDIWYNGANDIYGIGRSGDMVYLDVTQWQRIEVHPDIGFATFYDVWSSGSTVYTIGRDSGAYTGHDGMYFIAAYRDGVWTIEHQGADSF